MISRASADSREVSLTPLGREVMARLEEESTGDPAPAEPQRSGQN